MPASIEPIITLDAPAASAFTMSPEYLMPPSAITGTSPAPSTASKTAVSCGTPTPVTTRVVQIEPGPTPTFTASTPRSDERRAPVARGDVAGDELQSGSARARPPSPGARLREWPCAVSMMSTSTPASTSAARARFEVAAAPIAAATRRRPMLVLVRVRKLAALVNVLDRDQTAQHALRVHDGQLLDAVLAENLLGLVERRAHRRGDEILLRHRVVQRPVEAALELQIAIGDDADELARRVHDRHARDLEARSSARPPRAAMRSGESVIGLRIIPLSERFTRSTSAACRSIDMFLWITPIPPARAIAIAISDSVTVSIAAETSGTLSVILRVKRDARD